MTSRLNQSNKRRTLPSHHWVAAGIAVAVGFTVAALRYWVPSSLMPGAALGEAPRSQPTTPDQAVLGQGLHGVLAARRHEAARRRPQRRHHVPIQLDAVDQRAGHGSARGTHAFR